MAACSYVRTYKVSTADDNDVEIYVRTYVRSSDVEGRISFVTVMHDARL